MNSKHLHYGIFHPKVKLFFEKMKLSAKMVYRVHKTDLYNAEDRKPVSFGKFMECAKSVSAYARNHFRRIQQIQYSKNETKFPKNTMNST